METTDLAAVVALSEEIHPDLPESFETQASRLRIFPQGCHVLEDALGLGGYVFAHPIAAQAPPPLNQPLTGIPEGATQLYLHDLALHPRLRGSGAAGEAVSRILRLGQDYDAVALVSVYGTAPFWARFGFVPDGSLPAGKLASYGEGACFMTRPRQTP